MSDALVKTESEIKPAGKLAERLAFDPQQLDHGLYILYWKSGGFSLAAVGSLHSGERWFAATNWVAVGPTSIASTGWDLVESAELVESEREYRRSR